MTGQIYALLICYRDGNKLYTLNTRLGGPQSRSALFGGKKKQEFNPE